MKRAASPWAGVFSLLRQRPAACLGFAARAVLPLLTKLPRTARYWRAQVLNANGSKLIGPRSHGIANRLRWARAEVADVPVSVEEIILLRLECEFLQPRSSTA
jgi:hypothetical protein